MNISILLKKSVKTILIIIFTVVITLSVSVFALGIDVTRIGEQLTLVKKVCQADTKIQHSALNDVDEPDSVMLNAYINALNDDYAQYLSATDYNQKQAEWQGESVGKMGVDIAVNTNTNLVTVSYVNRNSPAKKAGLKVNDAIISVNKTNTRKKTPSEISELCTGKTGTEVNLTVLRNNNKINITVILGDFVSDSVSWKMLKDKIGYIKIITFNDTTYDQFITAYKYLKKNNAKGIVFDLRDNGGGTVDSCAKVLDELCPAGDTVRMKYKNGTIKTQYTSDENEINLPMSVLVNQYTASASEIFSMNMRDFGKADLIGTKTYGKGIAQTTYKLCDGSAIKFTYARIVDKNGKSYHGKGLTPDIKITLSEKQLKNYYFLTEKSDSQLKAAIESVKSKEK